MNKKGKVLFVDDEKRVLNSMRGLFRREYELYLTTDGAEAVELVAKHDIDVIVADQRMPGLTGVEVLGKVREASPRTVRILLTGYADPEAIEGSINIGEVFRFLSKPCQPTLLRETIKLGVDASRVATTAITRAARQTRMLQSNPPAGKPADEAQQPAATQASPPPVKAPMADSNATTAAAPDPTTAAADSGSANADDSLSESRISPTTPPKASTKTPTKTPTVTNDASQPIPIAAAATGGDEQTVSEQPFSPAPNEETEAATMPLLGDTPATNVTPFKPAANRDSDADDASHWQTHTEIVMSGDTSQEVEQLTATAELNARAGNVGVAVFTVNPTFAETAVRALSADRNTVLATTLVKVAEVLEQKEAGVLVTDFTSDISLLQNMIGTLKHHLPELVTIVVSENRDATDMINLINYGQVFRYVEKPIEPAMLRSDVSAAVLKHLQLVEHPELVQRHQVIDFNAPAGSSPTLTQFIGKVTRLRGRWTNSHGRSH